jgi:hypothetical protein
MALGPTLSTLVFHCRFLNLANSQPLYLFVFSFSLFIFTFVATLHSIPNMLQAEVEHRQLHDETLRGKSRAAE